MNKRGESLRQRANARKISFQTKLPFRCLLKPSQKIDFFLLILFSFPRIQSQMHGGHNHRPGRNLNVPKFPV